MMRNGKTTPAVGRESHPEAVGRESHPEAVGRESHPEATPRLFAGAARMIHATSVPSGCDAALSSMVDFLASSTRDLLLGASKTLETSTTVLLALSMGA